VPRRPALTTEKEYLLIEVGEKRATLWVDAGDKTIKPPLSVVRSYQRNGKLTKQRRKETVVRV